MNNTIQTTGGVLHQEDLDFIYKTICEVFNCNKEQINDLQPLQKGLSKSILTFELNGAVAGRSAFPWGMTLSRSLAGTRCMDRWDEGSWNKIPLDTEGSLP